MQPVPMWRIVAPLQYQRVSNETQVIHANRRDTPTRPSSRCERPCRNDHVGTKIVGELAAAKKLSLTDRKETLKGTPDPPVQPPRLQVRRWTFPLRHARDACRRHHTTRPLAARRGPIPNVAAMRHNPFRQTALRAHVVGMSGGHVHPISTYTHIHTYTPSAGARSKRSAAGTT